MKCTEECTLAKHYVTKNNVDVVLYYNYNNKTYAKEKM